MDNSNYASYSITPQNTKGKLHNEDLSSYRTVFERDYDRVIRSNTFRRLQYKTQVLVNHAGDHFRNRMTHSLETASMARSLASNLNVNVKLAETIALCHDLGHSPFGHAGEDELKKCMLPYADFCHNAHAIKILTQIESPYHGFSGLNLSWEVLEGIAKHNGPIVLNIPKPIADYDKIHNLDLAKYPSIESQISSLADDISYSAHDMEDGIRANLFDINKLIDEVEIISEIAKKIKTKYLDVENLKFLYEINRRMTEFLFEDVLKTTKANIVKYNISSVEDIMNLDKPLASFSERVEKQLAELKKFLMANIYKHQTVYLVSAKCKMIIRKLFDLYMNDPKCLPLNWQKKIDNNSDLTRATIVCDYIACMTDRYAIDMYQSFYNLNFKNL
jgi:dGTPase